MQIQSGFAQNKKSFTLTCQANKKALILPPAHPHSVFSKKETNSSKNDGSGCHVWHQIKRNCSKCGEILGLSKQRSCGIQRVPGERAGAAPQLQPWHAPGSACCTEWCCGHREGGTREGEKKTTTTENTAAPSDSVQELDATDTGNLLCDASVLVTKYIPNV